jgi:hypothetical protein
MTHHQLIEHLIKSPLYQKFDLKTDDIDAETRRILLSDGRFDLYCPQCRKSSTWALVVNPEMQKRAQRESMTSVVSSHGGFSRSERTHWAGEFKLRISCTREPLHSAVFHFVSSKNTKKKSDAENEAAKASIVKIGQTPSLADFESGDLSGLEKGLTQTQRDDFVRAIRTASHGFYIAACVYYRRVFESIIEDAKQSYMSKHGLTVWSEFEDASSTADRIKLLKSELPGFLFEHPHFYKLLSMAVHTLTEKECGEEIQKIKETIEHIVRDRIIQRERADQQAALSKFISQAIDKHANTEGRSI